VRVAELVEAEGRVLRHVVGKMGVGLLGLLGAGVLLLAGVALLLIALYGVLESVVPPPGAAAITGVVCLVVAAGVLWLVRNSIRG
jgi:hypothetical protein